jgi:hypothetical protein
MFFVINGKQVSDPMQTPSRYLTSDYVPMYVDERVKNLSFTG